MWLTQPAVQSSEEHFQSSDSGMRSRWTICLHPTVQPVVYQRNRKPHGRVSERAAHKYPRPPIGAPLMVMAKGCRCLDDWVLLLLALGTSLRSVPEWEAYRWTEQSTGLAGWPEGALLLKQAEQEQSYSHTQHRSSTVNTEQMGFCLILGLHLWGKTYIHLWNVKIGVFNHIVTTDVVEKHHKNI